MGTMTAYRGIAELINGGKIVAGMPESFSKFASVTVLGLPTLVWIYIAVAALGTFIMSKTLFGRNVYAVGSNAQVAELSGISVHKTSIFVFAISGALAGLAGCLEIGAVQHRLMEGISANYGWDAIPVALIGRQNPLLILLSALLFAALKVGSNAMQTACSVPNNLSSVLQGMVVLFALGSSFFVRYRIRYIKPKWGEGEAAHG